MCPICYIQTVLIVVNRIQIPLIGCKQTLDDSYGSMLTSLFLNLLTGKFALTNRSVSVWTLANFLNSNSIPVCMFSPGSVCMSCWMWWSKLRQGTFKKDVKYFHMFAFIINKQYQYFNMISDSWVHTSVKPDITASSSASWIKVYWSSVWTM